METNHGNFSYLDYFQNGSILPFLERIHIEKLKLSSILNQLRKNDAISKKIVYEAGVAPGEG